MVLEKELTSIKRFGARYGRSVKHKFGKVEHEQRQEYKCPSCNYQKVKRVAAGIWQCRKCGVKFAGMAYSIGKPKLKDELLAEKYESEPAGGA